MDVLEKTNKYSCQGPYLPAQKYQIGKQAERFDIIQNLARSTRNHLLKNGNQALKSSVTPKPS